MTELSLIVEFDIPAGRLDDFKAATREVIEATGEETGAQRYDWYVSEDGRRDINLERFEDSAAFVIHDAHVAPIVGPMMETCALRRFAVLGDPSDEVRAQLAGRDIEFYSHLIGIERSDRGSFEQLLDIVIKPGQQDELLASARDLVALSAGEPGTTRYDWYLSSDGSGVKLIEAFEDGAAYLSHMASIGPFAQAFLDAADVTGAEVLGVPGEAREALAQAGTTFFGFFSGIDR